MNNKLTQNQIEYLSDQVSRSCISADEANVQKVLMARYQLVINSIPARVRKALNKAVKDGRLCHIKREGKRPEVFYHPDFRYLAVGARKQYEKGVNETLSNCLSKKQYEKERNK